MADEPQIESWEDRNPGEILDIRFQKNPNQKLKYLEAEPKILGVTQISLAVFLSFAILLFYVNGMSTISDAVSGGTSVITNTITLMPLSFIMAVVYTETACLKLKKVYPSIINVCIIIAGRLAIAAQNLHLPTLKACLGMQVVACTASVICILMHLSVFTALFHCWMPDLEPSQKTICRNLETGFENYLALHKLVLSVQIALSATLAAYCCKVIQCCCPTSSMPVITVNRPPDPR